MSGKSPASPEASILLVEDDRKLAGLVVEYLQGEGFKVDWEARGDGVAERVVADPPDLVILDVMLPGIDGFEVCRRLRPAFAGPVLMLTARGDEIDEVVGLELGADDYVAKPVRPRVLLTRIRTLLRREARRRGAGAEPVGGGTDPAPHRRIAVGRIVIDSGCRTVTNGGREVELTTAEFDLLWLLALRCGHIVTRDEIYSSLRGIEYDGLDRSIDLRVARLRRKLGDDGRRPRLIKSVRGSGYLLATVP